MAEGVEDEDLTGVVAAEDGEGREEEEEVVGLAFSHLKTTLILRSMYGGTVRPVFALFRVRDLLCFSLGFHRGYLGVVLGGRVDASRLSAETETHVL